MHAPTAGINELQGYAKWLGRLFTAIAGLMTFSFGFALGGDSALACWLMGIGLASVTVLVAILLNFVDIAWRSGQQNIAMAIFAFWAVCVGAEYFSHVGFTVGHRSSNVQEAVLQDTKYDDARATVADLSRTLKDLRAKYDWQKSYDPPDAYAARIETAAKAVEVEAARGGCKTRCLALKQTHASLVAEQAIAADRLATQEEIKMVEGKLDAARKAAGTTAKGDSAVFSQAAMVAQLTTGSLKPTEAALHWAGIGIGAFISLVFSFASTVCNFIGFRDWASSERPVAGIRVEPKGTPPHRPSTHETHTVAQPIILTNKALREWAEKHMPQLKVA